MKRIILIFLTCLTCIVYGQQKTVDLAVIIHTTRLDELECMLFYDVRNKIPQLSQWDYCNPQDTIYAIESWNHEDGTFSLMYWDRHKTVSVLQDKMNDSIMAYNRRGFSKRIISIVEEWNPEKMHCLSGKMSHSDYLYVTRIIINHGDPIRVNTLCIPDIFLKDDIEDSMELFMIWHPSAEYE